MASTEAMKSTSRRRFLGLGSAALALGPGLAHAADSGVGGEPPAAAVGSQLYGWGQYYGREGRRIEDHMDEVLSALRDAGYDYAEGSVDWAHPEKNAEFAARLRSKGLRPVSLYSGGAFHEDASARKNAERLVAAARVCKEAGFSVIVCNPNPIGRNKTDAELALQGAVLGEIGRELKKIGLRFGIHHHTPELANNAREYHYNFTVTEPGEVDFCIDTHWMYRGGVVPMDALRQYGRRVVSWHLRQSRDKVWWEDMDTGDIDYAEIGAFAGRHGLPRRFSVELALEDGTKITRNAVENHRRSREFVRRVFGV
jgi:inosose dehydratase